MQILLNNANWTVKGFWPYVPLLGKSMELGEELMGVTEWMDAVVPGGVHADLMRHGLIEDPYFEQNSLLCEWVENRWWLYRCVFESPHVTPDKQIELVFKGVDNRAHFYINGTKLGFHEGMYEWVCFDITDKLLPTGENELLVLLEHAPDEMSQIGHTSMTHTQKSRFNYKWDFGTRLVNIGIWDDVLLRVRGACRLNDVNIQSYLSPDLQSASISVSSEIQSQSTGNCTASICITYNQQPVAQYEEQIAFHGVKLLNVKLNLPQPRIWYPNGMGEQPLYQVHVHLFDEDGQLSDAEIRTVGLRTVQYRQNENSPADALPYTFVINNIPVHIRGVNMVPLDHLYGNVSGERYEQYVQLLKQGNINLVRVWGGGIIEKEKFYDLCDQYGIMVWQEFIQSSSGVDNIPSVRPNFLRLLEASARQAIKNIRSHVSHVVWSGGNELRGEDDRPVTYDHPNIQMLKEIVEEMDPQKLFLPSSASGPLEFLDPDQPGMNHDVHGPWKYEGTREHYDLYNRSDSLFHSEFGNNGNSSMTCLRSCLKSENLYVTDMVDNLVWRHHGEWWDSLPRDQAIFGQFASLEQFVLASQFMQAEGLRYALEANQRRAFENSGSIIWHFNDPWPNVASTSLVEYTGIPKMAYYWTRQAYQAVHATLRYENLFCAPDTTFTASVHLHGFTQRKDSVKVEAKILDLYGNCLLEDSITCSLPQNGVKLCFNINEKLPAIPKGLFFVRLKSFDSSHSTIDEKIYLFSQKAEPIFSELLQLPPGNLKQCKQKDGWEITNTGDTVCLFVHTEFTQIPKSCVFVEKNFATLFPGETVIQTVHFLKDCDFQNTSTQIQCWNGRN